ncbi:MAG: RluA family pseudouridine synthase [Synergistaceae bacterium]|jgi:23S rRNA pseudouridine955/2504/2580 synthase|nr:RluA family pseudouridine synthase [Synergistaceae bacterium]
MKQRQESEVGGPGRGRRPDCFTVTADQADRRLDRVLRGLYPDVPLSAIMRAIRHGEVRIDGAKSDGAARLAAGCVVTTPWAAERGRYKQSARIAAPDAKALSGDRKLRTILRADSLWFVDKPPGLLSQPDRRGGDSVVTRAWDELCWRRDDFRPALVGRLDRNVSGVMMIALDAPTLRLLWRLMSEDLVKKTYRAVVRGRPDPAAGEIDMPLRKDERANMVTAGEGLDALTRYRVLDAGAGKGFSLVELDLVTGRPHQARAHMSAIGCPIAGDSKYGPGQRDLPKTRGKNRIFLHAYSLGLPDNPSLPQDIRGITVVSPLPETFRTFLA